MTEPSRSPERELRDAQDRARTAERSLAEEKTASWKRTGWFVAAAVVLVAGGGSIWPGYTLSWNLPTRLNAATEEALKPVVAKYLPAECVELAKADPNMAAKLAVVAEKQYGKESEFIKTGWVDIKNYTLSVGNKNTIAKACMEVLIPPPAAAAAANG